MERHITPSNTLVTLGPDSISLSGPGPSLPLLQEVPPVSTTANKTATESAKRVKSVIRYSNQSGAFVEVIACFDPDSARMPMLFGAQCTGCLDFHQPLFRTRITKVRRWAETHSATCRALPQPEPTDQ